MSKGRGWGANLTIVLTLLAGGVMALSPLASIGAPAASSGLTIAEVPGAPTNVTLSSHSDSTINVSWTNPTGTLTSDNILVYEEGGSCTGYYGWVQNLSIPVSTNWTVTSLAAAVEYGIEIYATSSDGSGPLSVCANIATNHAPPSPPWGVSATGVSDSEINVTWNNPSPPLVDNHVYEYTGSGCSGTPTAFDLGGVYTSFSVTGLSANTTYNFTVTASANGGEGSPSTCTSGSTLPAPPAPTSFSVSATTDTTINVTWVNPPGPVTNITVLWGHVCQAVSGNSEGTWSYFASMNGTPTNYTATGLGPGESYCFSATAWTAAGQSAQALPAQTNTANYVPPPPTDLTATAVSDSQVNLTWTNPTGTLLPLSDSRIYWGTSCDSLTLVDLEGVYTSYAQTALSPSTTYCFEADVGAVDAFSPTGAPANATTFPLPPAAPTNVAATTVSYEEINVSWTAPTGNISLSYIYKYAGSTCGGSILSTYDVPGDLSWFGIVASPDTTLSFTVAASTWPNGYIAEGVGPASACVTATTFYTPPAAPTSMIARSWSPSQVNLTWVNPSGVLTYDMVYEFSGVVCAGEPLTSFEVSLSASFGYLVNELSPSTPYSFTVAAATNGGQGPTSNCGGTTTLDPIPAAPTGVSATATSNSTIFVAWTNPAGNLTEIFLKEYRGYFCSGNGSVYVTSYVWDYRNSNFTVTGLSPQTAYAFTVTAESNGGMGPPSFCHSATTFSTPPPPPTPGSAPMAALFALYDNRTDLQTAFPNAHNSSTSLAGLLDWAGGVVTHEYSDDAYSTLAPFGYYSDLMMVYNGRSDLQSAFPGVVTMSNSTNYALLVDWAGGVVTGQWTDSANATLAPYGYYYDLLAVYDGRADLLAAFPDSLGNQSAYVSLVNWAGGVVAGHWTDSANATLQPFGYYYALMLVYDGRADLTSAFPSAFTVGGSYQSLVNWAKGVVTGAFTDSAYSTLLPFAASYLALATSNPTPIGTAFVAGNPVSGTCRANATFAGSGCKGGDHIYTLSVEASSVTFGSVLFEVLTATDAVYHHNGTGGFSVISIEGTVAAQTSISSASPMQMTSTFGTYGSGISVSTPLTSTYTIVLDMGTTNPAGMGLTFEVTGTGSYSGTTSPVSLP